MAGHHQKDKCIVLGCFVFRFGLLNSLSPSSILMPSDPQKHPPQKQLFDWGKRRPTLALHPSIRYVDLKIWKGGMWNVPQGIEDMWPVGKQTVGMCTEEVLAGGPPTAPKGH